MDTAVSVISGILLLLCGIHFMRHGLQNILGNRLHQTLIRITVTPWRGLLVGILASVLMQSSTAVSLITIGLVSAEYLSFYQSLGIILGANIGTCSTVQLLALSLPDQYLLPLLVFFMVLLLIKKLRYMALAISSFLCIFIGINLISSSLSHISELNTALEYIAAGKTNPGYGIAGGILITLLLQSSSAATALLMVFANEGIIDLTTAIYVVYGNNIGSCLSSLIIGLASPLAGKRVAAAHIILNIVGVLIFLPFTKFLAYFMLQVSPEIPGQIALAHTTFNIVSSLIVIPFTKQFARLIILLVPDRR